MAYADSANTVTPDALRAGLTASWSRSFPNYPAGQWTLNYYLRGLTGQVINLTGTAGTDLSHQINVPPATTASWQAGDYYYEAQVTDGTNKYLVEQGKITILTDLSAVVGSYDGRSSAKIIFDALEAAISGMASAQVLSTSINGKSVQRMSLAEKIAARDRYAQIVKAEDNAQRLKDGLPSKRDIRARFTPPDTSSSAPPPYPSWY